MYTYVTVIPNLYFGKFECINTNLVTSISFSCVVSRPYESFALMCNRQLDTHPYNSIPIPAQTKSADNQMCLVEEERFTIIFVIENLSHASVEQHGN